MKRFHFFFFFLSFFSFSFFLPPPFDGRKEHLISLRVENHSHPRSQPEAKHGRMHLVECSVPFTLAWWKVTFDSADYFEPSIYLCQIRHNLSTFIFLLSLVNLRSRIKIKDTPRALISRYYSDTSVGFRNIRQKEESLTGGNYVEHGLDGLERN